MSAHRDRERGRGLARSRCRDQSGNILVLFAILLPLFLFTGMIVIDVGYWWANARKAQIAADACALAAARDLPQNWTPARTDCVHDGRDYVLTNLPDQTGTDVEPLHVSTAVLSPFEGNSTQVEATVEMRVQTFFGRFIGLGGIELTRRAVAEQAVGEGRYAIYAHNDGCPADGTGNSLIFNGEHHIINGRVHSNGEYRINNNGGPTGEAFWAQEGTMVGCLTVNPPGTAHFGGDSYSNYTSEMPNTVATQTWPGWWTPAEFGWIDALDSTDGCDVKGKSILIKEDGGGTRIEVDTPLGAQPQLSFPGNTITNPYVYCAWEKFTINRDGLEATMTALSPEITVDGNGQVLTGYKGNSFGEVLFFAVPNITNEHDGSFAAGGNDVDCNPEPPGAKTLTLNGNDHVWTGVIFAPCSRVKVNVGGTTAGNAHLTGTILGWEVEVNGKDFRMEGNSKFGGTVILALDQ
jgi:hypothetical protein